MKFLACTVLLSAMGLLAGCSDGDGDNSDDSTSTSDGSTVASGTTSDASSTSSGSGAGSGTGGAGGSSTGTAGLGGASNEITVEMTLDKREMQVGEAVQATVVVTNFILEEPGPNEAGHGHYHIYLDTTKSSYLIADQEPTTVFELKAGTTPGAHTIIVSLGQNNHAPLNPPVEDSVEINVLP